jgi:GntR family transcriptional repressor for pyruvate dehydrogenase complex
MAELNKIDTSQIQNQVYDSCRSMIQDGTWGPGDKLPSENQLADQLGVSRVSVRSALQSLQAQGMIEIRRGEGSFVLPFNLSDQLARFMPHVILSEADILDVLEYRLVTEPEIVSLAMAKADSQDILDLEELFEQMENSLGDIKNFARLDELFHIRLAEIMGNKIIERIYRVLLEVMSSAWLEICEVLGVEDGLHYHRELILAIKAGDRVRGSSLMKEHVERTRVRMGEYFSNRDSQV